ncbi:hypothetical protein NDU88_002572 [Pleurodeles waltl]|uniref:Uncharacterized protein n=1 Tax=Pleurodeles waltl TaxID=8319 RepID=A0AAV7M8K4_PLEWA|nr:hypothetical protein NDU88_002572 [Pleurodeles waltl]
MWRLAVRRAPTRPTPANAEEEEGPEHGLRERGAAAAVANGKNAMGLVIGLQPADGGRQGLPEEKSSEAEQDTLEQ